jgi:hypothetical protein
LDDDFFEQALTIINSKDNEQINKVLSSQGINSDDFPVHLTNNNNSKILKAIYYALSKYEKSDKQEYAVSSITTSSKCVIINNTFILVLKKDIDNDTKPTELIKRISDELVKSENKNSFIQLLGLETQTVFNENENFINENLLKSSTEALFAHRNYLKSIDDNSFNELIKKLLVEHATLQLRTSKLSLLNTDFLDTETPKYSTNPSDEEIASMNTFFNSVQNLNKDGELIVNFGDIFKDDKGNYYLCITALCDCLRPKKIDYNYFFVTGKEVSLEIANSLGDVAFLSYIPSNKVISWIQEPLKSKIKDCTDLEKAKKEIEKLRNKLEISNYKPLYIKPHIYNIKNPQIIDGKIEIRRIETPIFANDKIDNGNINLFDVFYVTTLRPNYTQRIANHAFTHPVRVGVDFISKR